MEREKDFITQFVEAVEQARERDEAREAEAHKYDGLENKQTIIEGWKRYRALSNGDVVICGAQIEDFVFVENVDKLNEAFDLLSWLFNRLRPFADSIVMDYEARKMVYHHDDWMMYAYDIIQEYKTQEPLYTRRATIKECLVNPESNEFPYLQKELDTEKARKYFSKADDLGWLTITPRGYKWYGLNYKKCKKPHQGQLAYLCGKIFGYVRGENVQWNIGDHIPYTKLEKLFGVKKLYRTMQRVYEVKKVQPWRKTIDELFEE